jgi:hypothetical protein
MADYRIFSRNPDLTKDAEITDFTSLEFISRFNQPGAWKMTGHGRPPFILRQGIIIERGGDTVFTGIIREAEKRMDAENFIKQSWTFSGVDDLARIAERTAHPDPVNLTITAQANDVRTGPAETVILNYVNANCGPSAHVSRRFPVFQVAPTQGRGKTITGSARFYNLLDFIYNLARLAGDIGFRVRLNEATYTLVFEVFEPADHSSDVIFSTDFGNLQSFAYMFKAPEANVIYTLGQGVGTARAYHVASDPASVDLWGRLETVKDQRNEPDAAKLADWAQAELSEAGELHGFSVSPLALGSVGFVYGLDYNLGDLVTVADDGIAFSERVTEIAVKLDENGNETITPTIGMLKDIPLRDTFEAVEDLDDRVTRLEASQ